MLLSMKYFNVKDIALISRVNNSSDYYLGIIKGIYNKVLFSIPFNNIAHFYELDGMFYPEKNGLDCIGTCRYLIEELEKNHIPAVYLRNENGESGHHLVLGGVPGNYFILDPILQHAEPIILGKIDEEIKVNAYPFFKDEYRKTILSMKFDGRKICIEKYLNIKNKKLTAGNYVFDINNQFRDEPNALENYENGYYYNSLENQLMLRILDKEKQENISLLYPISKLFSKKIIDETQLYIRSDNGQRIDYSSEHFSLALMRIASKLEITSRRLINYFMGGVKLYYEFAPKDFIFTIK